MTRPPNEPNQDANVSIPITDGGEDFYENEEITDEHTDEYVEHYPDPFASEEPAPRHDSYLPQYDHNPHLQPGYDGDLDPP